ncbi:bifunctional ([pyruvate, phosphate dikinase] phosphate) phosphotransferase/[pyruvate, phosphate dikinase] kinase [Suicoccus acidiformans]|uniref:Putative pyruvate, phosphate dikinase regulatory protein n=1 Tax=Suicoccus acidiformans TaxID=2036206 RepID=A0A347WLG9_9LACT|nr:pyruvate, water dikinase regulatory protein [Suicoccus acidiformans]AXY25926.1 bifunctional ([pyruvate, phosphate dikinase] phosphate) phosphotransferase/[pyruvate, phosphate dikinase] kinase [Suicoccus acidiformans]
MSKILHYYILSDSVGDTALKVARSALAQFPEARTKLHRHNFVNDTDALNDILQEAAALDGLVFITIADNQLAKYVERFCIETGLICYNLIQPFVLEIQRRLEVEPSEIAGAQHELSDAYFKRIEAIEFCIQYDDGRDPSGMDEAEIIIIGISRTGKTPLSMYLGTLGYKVLNIPLIPENEPPVELFKTDKKKIIGLTNDPYTINRLRETRMIEYGMDSGTRYASIKRVEEELNFADELYRQLDCPVINVVDRSIEESATIILDIMNMPVRYN